MLLGYSSLIPKPLIQGYLLLLLVGLCVCASCLQFSREAEEKGTFSEFDEGTRNLQLLWMNIISTIVSLVVSDNVVIREPGHDEK